MKSFQVTITPNKRASGRFVSHVRRSIQKALVEEKEERGVTQSDIARAIGVNRSVISREIRGHKDLTLSRVAELAWALGRKPLFDLPKHTLPPGSNLPLPNIQTVPMLTTAASTPVSLPSSITDILKTNVGSNVPA